MSNYKFEVCSYGLQVNSLVGSPDMLNSLLIENLKGNFEDISSVLVLPDGYIPRRNSNILQQIANYFRLEGPQLRVGMFHSIS